MQMFQNFSQQDLNKAPIISSIVNGANYMNDNYNNCYLVEQNKNIQEDVQQIDLCQNNKVEFQMKRCENVYYYEISNLNAFISKRKVEEICKQTFNYIKEQHIQQGKKAKELIPGGLSNRILLNCSEGVFFIQKMCERYQDAKKEKSLIKILSDEGITLPLVESNKQVTGDCCVEQVAGVQSLHNIIQNISYNEYYKQKAFIPFVQCLIVQLFDKLRKMHEKGFAHSDIKPGNIVMGFDRYFYFIDFGGSVKIQDQNNDYLSCYTEGFNIKWYLKKKPRRREDIIRCDNSQLSLSIIRLLCQKDIIIKSFNEMENSDFIQLANQIFKAYNQQSNPDEKRDFIKILIFLFQFVIHEISFDQISSSILEEINTQLEEKIDNIEAIPHSLQFESVFPLQEVIDMFSKIEEIEFLPKLSQIKIKNITIDNIRYIELLQELGYEIKCDDFLSIEYEQISKYKKLKIKAEKLLKEREKNEQQQNLEIYNIFLEKKEICIQGHFQNNQDKKKEKKIKLDYDLNMEENKNNDQKYQNQLVQAIYSFSQNKIKAFDDSMKNIKKKFKKEHQNDFKNVFNFLIVKMPKQIELLNREINEDNLKYLEQLVQFNQKLTHLSLDLSLIKNEQSFNKLASILTKFQKKKQTFLILQNIQGSEKQFVKKVLLNKWTSLSISLSKKLSEDDFNLIFSGQNSFQAETLKIIFSMNIINPNSVSNLLKTCENVEDLQLDFLQNSLQQNDEAFKNIFIQNQQNCKIKNLRIYLQRDESKNNKLNEILIKFIKNQKSIEYFEFEIKNNQLDEETVRNNEMKEISEFKKKQKIQFKNKIKFTEVQYFIQRNYDKIEEKPDKMPKLIQKNQIHLKDICLQNLQIEQFEHLENIFQQIFKCEQLETLDIQVKRILNKKKETQSMNSSQNQAVQLKNISKLKLSFSDTKVLKFNSSLIEQFLMINPKQFKQFSIEFQEKYLEKDLKYPKKIYLQQQSSYQAEFQINPDFDDEDEQFQNQKLDFFELKSDYVNYSVEFIIKDIFGNENGEDLKKKFIYLFANIFKNKISKLKIIIADANYSICYQIKQALNDICKIQRNKTNKQLEVFLEINSYQHQFIKELIDDLQLIQDLAIPINITIQSLNKENLDIIYRNRYKIKLTIKDLDYKIIKEQFKTLKKFCNPQSNCNITLLYSNEDLFNNVRNELGNDDFQQINKIIKKEIKEEDLNSLNQNANSQIKQEEIQMNQNELSRSSDNSILPLLKDDSSKDFEINPSQIEQEQINNQQFDKLKMIQKDFSIFVPYYQFEYTKNGVFETMKISKTPDKFTLPLDKIDYLDKLSICAYDNSDLNEIIVNFSQQKLDLDSALKIVCLFKQKYDEIKSVTLNFEDARSSYKHEDALNKLDLIILELNKMKNLENLNIYINNSQFDKQIQIQNFKNLKNLELQIPIEISQQFICETLDNVDNNNSLKYKIFNKKELNGNHALKSDEQPQVKTSGNEIQIENIYCKNQMHSQFFKLFMHNCKQLNNTDCFIIKFEKARYVSFQFLSKVFESLKSYFQESMQDKQFQLNFQESIYQESIEKFYQTSPDLSGIVKYIFKSENEQKSFNSKIIKYNYH
ncbi:hypothetical protein ABPG74_007953 [Tetrahymena malaccensis]